MAAKNPLRCPRECLHYTEPLDRWWNTDNDWCRLLWNLWWINRDGDWEGPVWAATNPGKGRGKKNMPANNRALRLLTNWTCSAKSQTTTSGTMTIIATCRSRDWQSSWFWTVTTGIGMGTILLGNGTQGKNIAAYKRRELHISQEEQATHIFVM